MNLFPPPRRWKTSRCREHLPAVSGSCRRRSRQVRGRFGLFKQAPGFISALPRAARITFSPQTQKHMFGYVRLWPQGTRSLPYISFFFYNPYPWSHSTSLTPSTAQQNLRDSVAAVPSFVLSLFSIKTGNGSDYGSALLISHPISFSLAGMELTCLPVCSSC